MRLLEYLRKRFGRDVRMKVLNYYTCTSCETTFRAERTNSAVTCPECGDETTEKMV